MTFDLYLMRHAKPDWSDTGLADFDRPINKRGYNNARRVGQWMKQNQYIPQQVVSSPALRAKQTTELLVNEFNSKKSDRVIFDKELYLAEMNTLIDLIKVYQAGLNSLMIVSHNPGLEALLYYLNPRGLEQYGHDKSVTTANLIIINFDRASVGLDLAAGQLVEFITPRELG